MAVVKGSALRDWQAPTMDGSLDLPGFSSRIDPRSALEEWTIINGMPARAAFQEG
jgi:hypothetical protein